MKDEQDLSYIEAALDKVLATADDYLDASDAEEAIAAIEVLAKLRGKSSQCDAYTEAVDCWVKAVAIEPNAALLKKARHALDRIASEDSELYELWSDSDSFTEWKALLDAQRVAVTA